jgi:hypothetical protein
MRSELMGTHARKYLPAGVADDEGRLGYVAAAGGGVDALDLGTGATRWHAEGALVPVLGLDEALIAMSTPADGPPRLQLIDRGAVAFTSAPLPWRPPHASVEIVAAALEGSVVRWAWRAFEASVAGGIRRARSNAIDSWAASVDLASGVVARLDFAAAAPQAPLQRGGGGVRDQRGADAPWAVDDLVVALADEGGRLVLRRWQGGSPLPPVELLPSLPPPEELRWVRTPDRWHVFLVDVRADGLQRFRIWDSLTGAAVGEVAVELAAEPGTVGAIGDDFYAIVSREQNALVAFSIVNGARKWSHIIVGHAARELASERKHKHE